LLGTSPAVEESKEEAAVPTRRIRRYALGAHLLGDLFDEPQRGVVLAEPMAQVWV
jgi:hypothetical protein